MNALEMISTINAVEGFNPMELAVKYTDLSTGESRDRLPVMAQMAWFRLKYPEGRVAITVQAAKECFVATARVYKSYDDPPEHFLAEATASRGYVQDKPTISPREWAQTAAVGIALRNAGFGLQFQTAGEGFETPAVDELGDDTSEPLRIAPKATAPAQPVTYEKALTLKCPIRKYADKTLGDLITLDPKALVWITEHFEGDIMEAAKLICEHAEKMAA
ncbi:MAG: hypothetical protein FWH26_07890 [Oscillospiraceae bacterium]|nr:hypothetical protein [Oscillospiraceae bacterium]